MWKMCQAPHNGKSVKSKHVLPEINPCPFELFYCLARPMLEQGREVIITKKRPGTKTEQVTRQIVETDLQTIEAFCTFQNFSKTHGYCNTRRATRKAVTFYNVILQVTLTHYYWAKSKKQYALIKLVVASLNPSATTIFPVEFERSERNIERLQRYLQGFPIRLKKDGFDVCPELVAVCKEHAKARKRKRATNGSTSQ